MPNATHRAVLAYLESALMAEEALAQSQALNYAHAPLYPSYIDRTPDNPYVPLNFNSCPMGLDWRDFQDDFDRPEFY